MHISTHLVTIDAQIRCSLSSDCLYSEGTVSETKPLVSDSTTTTTTTTTIEYESISTYIDDCYYGDSQPLSNTFFMWRMWALFIIFLSSAGSGKADSYARTLLSRPNLNFSPTKFTTTTVTIATSGCVVGLMVIYNVEAVAEALGVCGTRSHIIFIHSFVHLKFDYVSSSDHDQVTPSAYFVTLISLANGLGRVTAGIEIVHLQYI